MLRFLKKISWIFFTTMMTLSFIFVAIRVIPGDPIERILGSEAKESEILNYRKQLMLDRSIQLQFLFYWKNILTGDLGESLFKKQKVSSLIKQAMSPSLILAITAIFCSTFLGILLGAISASYQHNFLDYFLRTFAICGLSIPIFSLAPILVYFFAIKLEILPVSEWGSFKHVILPVMSLTIPLSAIILRVTRGHFLEESKSIWVQVLWGKGMANWGVKWRILKACLTSILNVVAIQFSVVLSGTIITETIFDIPGIGTLLFEAIQNRDYPLVQGIIIYTCFVYMIIYGVTDLINEKIDPRLT